MKIQEQFTRLRDQENWHPLPQSAGRVPRPRRAAGPLIGLAAAAAVVAAVAVGTTWLAPSGTHNTQAVGTKRAVAWRPIPAHQGALLLTSSKSAPPACRAASLQIAANGGGGAGGTFFVPVTVKNTGAKGCTVSDAQVVFRWAAGHSVAGDQHARILLPQGSQVYQLAFAPSCTSLSGSAAAGPMTASLSGITIENSAASIPGAVSGCSTATATAVTQPNAQDAGTGPYSALRVSLDLPAQANAGTTLSYNVTLTNTGSAAFSFGECPTYTQMAGSATGEISEQSYTLNCAGGGPIPPGESRTYAMQLQLPSGTGLAKFAWIMDSGPSGNGTTDIQ